MITSAPAKINLGLRVVGCRADGYHELDSVFLPLDLADEIEIAVEPASELGVSIRVDGLAHGVPADASNLAVRAVHAFAEASGLRASVDLRIHKNIPNGAGLGGGSSDAAAVLRVLRDCDPSAVTAEALCELALGLGADVPFFLDPQPCRVTGIGERLQPVRKAPALPLLLANPGERLATAEVFRAYDALNPALTAGGRDRTIPPLSGAENLEWETLAPGALAAGNDLEPSAVRLCPPVARLRERIQREGPRAVGMSGSGPTVFAVFETERAAREAMTKIGFEPPLWARVATTIESR